MIETCPAPLDDAALEATWAAAWSSLGRPAPTGLQAELMTAWSEPQQRYHDQRHLRECLALWTRWREHCARAGEVAIALWFHDAIYDPQARALVLQSFLDRPRLCHGEHAVALLEAQARINLAAALSRLAQ